MKKSVLILYYTDIKTGEICKIQRAPEGWNEAQAKEAIIAFNEQVEEKNWPRLAHYKKVRQDGLEAAMLKAIEDKYKFSKEAIADALSALEEAVDCINALEVVT